MKQIVKIFSQKHLSKIVLGISFLVVSAGVLLSGVSTMAQAVDLAEEQAACGFKDKITIVDIIRPAKFVPLIPEDCAIDDNGSPRPLSLAILPDLLTRGFGLLASLVFYLFGFIVLFSGIQWAYGGIDEQNVTKAKRNLQDSVFALFLVFTVYVIINTVLSVLGVAGIANQDVSSFFSF